MNAWKSDALKIPNHKSQIPNESQFPNHKFQTKDFSSYVILVIGFCDLFGI